MVDLWKWYEGGDGLIFYSNHCMLIFMYEFNYEEWIIRFTEPQKEKNIKIWYSLTNLQTSSIYLLESRFTKYKDHWKFRRRDVENNMLLIIDFNDSQYYGRRIVARLYRMCCSVTCSFYKCCSDSLLFLVQRSKIPIKLKVSAEQESPGYKKWQGRIN